MSNTKFTQNSIENKNAKKESNQKENKNFNTTRLNEYYIIY